MKRQDSMGYQINHVARLFAQALRVRVAPHGVVPGQFAQLLALYEQEGVTQNQLCDQVKIDQSTMAHTLQRMERDELIQRVPDPADRRRALIMLTDRAREVQDDLVNAALRVNAVAMRGFTPEQVAVCLELVTRMIDNLEADGSEEEISPREET
ncbi:MarR family winged helix-turn-helix transcriptional regulator [Acrocarpospora phusangensis]|uniref:MarR family winged helix-turn-helix transcriptional regulator n=1 Tax=Acrocarpospora phusangensis TaxID=1070424 RepID=UPI001EF1F3BC|nr:MarR family winged helix-turn-helix transcriptional regulator [Acrocarpospora phusangensis]